MRVRQREIARHVLRMTRLLIFALTFSIAGAEEKPPPLDAGSYNQWKDALKSATATPAG